MSDPVLALLLEEVEHRLSSAPAAPTVEQVLAGVRRKHRHRAVAGAVVAVALVAGLVAVIRPAQKQPVRPVTGPTPTESSTATGPTSPQQQAKADAESLVAHVVVPDGATPLDRSPAPGLDNAPTVVQFLQSESAARWWTAPGSFEEVVAFFRNREENGVQSEGGGTSPSRTSQDRVASFEYGELQISVAIAGDGAVGIRASAQVPWTPMKPEQEHVPDGVTSVYLLAYRGTNPATVMAQRTVTGTDARRLAEEVNVLSLDNRGAHSCPLDRGDRIRLTFSSAEPDVVVDGFSCGSAVMTVQGVEQPALAVSGSLYDDVRTVLRLTS